MGDLFISHVEEDFPLVRILAARLEGAGYSCWFYERDSNPGPSYLEQTARAIAESRAVVLILSPDALESWQVDKEIDFAHESAKPFVPLFHRMTWPDLQRRRPKWWMAVGTSAGLAIEDGGVEAALPRLLHGLRDLAIPPGVISPVPPDAAGHAAPPGPEDAPGEGAGWGLVSHDATRAG